MFLWIKKEKRGRLGMSESVSRAKRGALLDSWRELCGFGVGPLLAWIFKSLCGRDERKPKERRRMQGARNATFWTSMLPLDCRDACQAKPNYYTFCMRRVTASYGHCLRFNFVTLCVLYYYIFFLVL